MHCFRRIDYDEGGALLAMEDGAVTADHGAVTAVHGAVTADPHALYEC